MMVTTSFVTGTIIIIIAWVVIILSCVLVMRKRRGVGRANAATINRGFFHDLEAGRARATTRQQPKTVARDFSPVPAYHRRESYGGPTVPAAVYAGTTAVDMPPAYSTPASAPTTTDTSGAAATSSSSGGGGGATWSTTA